MEFDAVIAEVVFFGDVHKYTAECKGGQLVTFKEHRSGGTPALRPGEPVRLGFLADEAVLLSPHR